MQINLVPDLSLLAIMVIFLLNYLIVRKFFLRPINEVLETRETESRTAEQLYEDAPARPPRPSGGWREPREADSRTAEQLCEDALARFHEATAQTEARLQVAKREAAQVRERFRGEAAADRQQVVGEDSGGA